MPLFLIAQIAGRAVAIDSTHVESVVDIGVVVPVPRAGDHVCGLAALRSRVVTVIDTHAALGLPPAADRARRAVITVVEGHHYAIMVDALEDVAPFDCLPLTPGLVLDKGWRRVGVGIVERIGGLGGNEPILVIELARIVLGLAALAA